MLAKYSAVVLYLVLMSIWINLQEQLITSRSIILLSTSTLISNTTRHDRKLSQPKTIQMSFLKKWVTSETFGLYTSQSGLHTAWITYLKLRFVLQAV